MNFKKILPLFVICSGAVFAGGETGEHFEGRKITKSELPKLIDADGKLKNADYSEKESLVLINHNLGMEFNKTYPVIFEMKKQFTNLKVLDFSNNDVGNTERGALMMYAESLGSFNELESVLLRENDFLKIDKDLFCIFITKIVSKKLNFRLLFNSSELNDGLKKILSTLGFTEKECGEMFMEQNLSVWVKGEENVTSY